MDEKAKKIVESYSERIKGRHIFFHPNIPAKKLNNALKKYAPGVNQGEVLALIDNSIAGSARHGALLTGDTIYAHNIMESAKCLKLKTIKDVYFAGDQSANKKLYINNEAFLNECSPKKSAMLLFADMLREMCNVNINLRTAADLQRYPKEARGEERKNIDIDTKKPIGLTHVGVVFLGLWILGVVGRICGLIPSNQYTVLDLITDVALPAGIILVIVGAIISSRKKTGKPRKTMEEEDLKTPKDSTAELDKSKTKVRPSAISGKAKDRTVEVSGSWMNQIWKEQPLQIYADPDAAHAFLSRTDLPYLWPDDKEYVKHAESQKDPQSVLRVAWTAAYLSHPNKQVILDTLRNQVSSELVNSWILSLLVIDLLVHPNTELRSEAAKVLWKCSHETHIRSVFGVLTGQYSGSKFSGTSLFSNEAKSIVENLRKYCPPERRELLEQLILDSFGPTFAGVEKKASPDKVYFKETTVKPTPFGISQTYEVYTGKCKMDALAFLEKKRVEIRNYYIVVETPEGNWGKDCMGIYQE